MKICIFAANYLPHMGGIENYTFNLSKTLISMGHEVVVVTSRFNDLLSHEFLDGIEVFRMPCYSLLGGRYPVCKVNKGFREIDRELADRNFDFIIIQARFYFHSVYAAKFAHRHNINCITIEHGTSHLSVNNKVLDFLGGIWEHGITAVLKRYCKHHYAVSKLAGEWSGHFGIKSEGELYNAVDLNAIEKKIKDRACSYRREYQIPANDIVITFTGRLIPEKGIAQLIKAVEELDNGNIWLFAAGEGPLLEQLKPQKNKRIIFLGRIDLEHIAALLDETDIYCLPSVSEGMPTAVLEAMVAKTFVITTRRGGASEIITDKSYGILMESNSVEEIKKAILESMDKEYRAGCAEKCYKRICDDFTWERTANKLIEVINSMRSE